MTQAIKRSFESSVLSNIWRILANFLGISNQFFEKHWLCVRIPATSYLVPLFTLIYLVLFHLLLPSYLDLPCYLNNRQRYRSVWPERDWTLYIMTVATLSTRYFREVLSTLSSPPFYTKYVYLPSDTTPIPDEIQNNSKFYPFFESVLVNSKHEAFVPLLMGLREGLRARKKGGMGVGRYYRGRKGYGTPGEYNHPFPPYQLTPNPHPLRLLYNGLLYGYRNPFQQHLHRCSLKLSPCAQFWVFSPNPPSPCSHL